MHFDRGKNKIQIFNFLAIPIDFTNIGGLRVLNFVQKGSRGTCFDHGQFEIKTFPINAPP